MRRWLKSIVFEALKDFSRLFKEEKSDSSIDDVYKKMIELEKKIDAMKPKKTTRKTK